MEELESDIMFLVDEDEHATALRKTILDNQMQDGDKLNEYEKYSTDRKGCSKENPFVINDASPLYIRLEKYLIEYIFMYRSDEYEHVCQRLCKDGDKAYDCLEIEVTPWGDCGADFDDEELIQDVHTEEFWFDITAGFKSNCQS